MHRTAVCLLLFVGCKKPTDHHNEQSIAEMASFADAMCRCTTAECADGVHRDRTRWLEKLMSTVTGDGPNEPQQKRMGEHTGRYMDCMMKLQAPPVADAGVVADAGRPGPDPVKQPATAGALLITASAWAVADRVRSAAYSYVGADGVLDPVSGAFDVQFGLPPVSVDDPNRRTGAPVPVPEDRPSACEHAAWSVKDGWSTKMMSCGEVDVAGPRCPVTEVWKRAIARGAPADALAVLHYQTAGGTGAWIFRISDPPRGVNVQLGFRDDCDLAVESTTPTQTPF